MVLSTPVFAALKRHVPGCHLTVWVRPEAGGVLAGHPHVDALLVDDKRGADRGIVGLLRQTRRVRAGRFEVAIALHRSLRSASILALARVPRRVGFRQSAGWFLYPERVHRDASLHDVERNLSILSPLGIDVRAERPRPFVVPSPEAIGRVDALLREAGVPPDAPLIGIAPGSVWATKRWTREGYAQVAAALDAGGYKVLFLGAPGERPLADEVNERAGGVALNLAGRTDLPMLVAAIDRCRALVCNDSAPMHIAVARAVPVVAMFGPTHPKQGYGPFTEQAIVVQRDLSCRPCSRHGGARCPIGTHECMRAIEPGTVLAATHRLLEARAKSAPVQSVGS